MNWEGTHASSLSGSQRQSSFELKDLFNPKLLRSEPDSQCSSKSSGFFNAVSPVTLFKNTLSPSSFIISTQTELVYVALSPLKKSSESLIVGSLTSTNNK
jgi:hypothetical protein